MCLQSRCLLAKLQKSRLNSIPMRETSRRKPRSDEEMLLDSGADAVVPSNAEIALETAADGEVLKTPSPDSTRQSESVFQIMCSNSVPPARS